MSPASQPPETVLAKDASDNIGAEDRGPRVLFARALIGLIVLICAEVFSGASLKAGLWHPWTILVTYWLYFAHFFFFTTLAVRTGRTSLSCLYLWGVLFGLYESWITKVIWHGYSGDGKFAMGHIGPFGFSEISMVFIFHPVASFILPLTVSCLLCPPLRRFFPDLAWFTGKSKGARFVQGYLIFSFAPVMAMNSGGPINLAGNLAVAIILLAALLRLAGPALASSDGRIIVVFGRRGFAGLCVYLALLYGVTYFAVRPEGRPSAAVQLFTFVFYALAGAGLWLHHRREPLAGTAAPFDRRELRLVTLLFVVLLTLALALSMFGRQPLFYGSLALNFVLWTLSGFVFTALSVAKGVRESFGNAAMPSIIQMDNSPVAQAHTGDARKTVPYHHLVVFDGLCNFCATLVMFTARHDRHAVFRFVPIQSCLGQEIYHACGLDPEDAQTLVVVTDGRPLLRGDAILEVAKHFSGGWRLLLVFRLVPKRLRDWIYSFIARRRYRWFGRRDTCMVPSDEVGQRFL